MTFGAGDTIDFLGWLGHPHAALPDERALVGAHIDKWLLLHRDFRDSLAQADSSFAQREELRAEARVQCEPIVLGELIELWDAYTNECHMSHFRAHRTA
jgi:hypothetical protein